MAVVSASFMGGIPYVDPVSGNPEFSHRLWQGG
jgi:hypothetical protein